MPKAEEKLLEMMAAWNTGNPDIIVPHYGTTGIFIDPVVPKGIGAQHLVPYIVALKNVFPDLHFEIKKVIGNDSLAMAEWVQTGTYTHPLLDIPASGKIVMLPAVSVLELENGNVKRHTDYWDLDYFKRALQKV